MINNSVGRYTKLISVMLLAVMALVGQSIAMAQTLTPTAQAPTNEVEIVGSVSALSTQTITLGSQIFNISGAEVKADVAVGKLVKIHASQNTAGQWVAREIELLQPTGSQTPSPATTQEPILQDEFEIFGVVTGVNNTTIVIAGQNIDISKAEIKNALAVNSTVKVHVSVVNGVWIAREVENSSVSVTGTLVFTTQKQSGSNGQDDGPNHDQNDDRNGNNSGNGSGTSGSNNNSNDDHGNHGGSDNKGSHGGGNGSRSHGHG